MDVFTLNETFLKPEVPDSLYFVPGFTLYRRDRAGSRTGDGVMVYVNDELNVTEEQTWKVSSIH